MNVKTVRNGLIAAAIGTGALFAASVVKTPKQAGATESQVKTEQTYEWNPQQSVIANVKDGAVTTYNVATDAIKEGADKATDHPAPLGAALALELMGVGAAGAAVKRNKAKAEVGTKGEVQEQKEAKIREIKERIHACEKEIDSLRKRCKELKISQGRHIDSAIELEKEAQEFKKQASDEKRRRVGSYVDGLEGCCNYDVYDIYETREEAEARCDNAKNSYKTATYFHNEAVQNISAYSEYIADLEKEIGEKLSERYSLISSLHGLE